VVNVEAVVLVCRHTERNFASDVLYCLVRIHDVIRSRAPYSSLETGPRIWGCFPVQKQAPPKRVCTVRTRSGGACSWAGKRCRIRVPGPVLKIESVLCLFSVCCLCKSLHGISDYVMVNLSSWMRCVCVCVFVCGCVCGCDSNRLTHEPHCRGGGGTYFSAAPVDHTMQTSSYKYEPAE
jgi:hypothetical protein